MPGAALLGLGSILGTGVFVSIGIAAGVCGPRVTLAVPLAALVALFNGLSSAQLAASHPVSGGTYEYGHRWLTPALGFLAGWMFLCAKSASAATAALGCAGYLLELGGHGGDPRLQVGLGALAALALTAVVAGGIQRSQRLNALIVAVTVTALLAFVLGGLGATLRAGGERLRAPDAGGLPELLHGTALMFVAFTGYGRIATLGEEVHEPRRTIPRAIVLALAVSAALYVAVAVVAVGAAGAPALAEAARGRAAPLELLARGFGVPGLPWLVAAGAVTAMLGVLLNLLLGLSRVLLAMARRRDVPAALDRIEPASGSPRRAVLVMGAIVTGLVAIGDVKTTWSFSAFTVLVYYALTNLAALRLPARERRFPRAVPLAGLVSCLGLAAWVEREVWIAGLTLLLVGLGWHGVARRLARAG